MSAAKMVKRVPCVQSDSKGPSPPESDGGGVGGGGVKKPPRKRPRVTRALIVTGLCGV